MKNKIDFWKYYQEYLKYNKNEKIFSKYDPELKEVSKYLKRKGFLSINDLFEIARWKSSRRAADVRNNKKREVKNVTRTVFESDCPESKIRELDNLKGVGIPIGSAVLCMHNPENCGVIDIRAWNTLNKLDTSFIKKKISYFKIKDFGKYLYKIRNLAKQNKMTCRQIDMALWAWDKEKSSLCKNK